MVTGLEWESIIFLLFEMRTMDDPLYLAYLYNIYSNIMKYNNSG